ncbi:MAG TPA: hypothetical protein VIL49_17745, partial [Capillimicrobium sp.]
RQVVGRFIRRTPTPDRQMAYLLLPADARLKRLAHDIEEERRHALDLTPRVAEVEEGFDEPPEDAERAAAGEGFEALSSSGAMLDEAILSQTTMQLFAFDEPAPPPAASAALAAFGVDPKAAAGGGAAAAPQAAISSSAPGADAAFASRERLREERSKLVAQVARRTGETHREIHARVNRRTGVTSVSAATREQLEKGNELLQRDLSR